MQEDFHYYATYCAAFLAGYSHEESMQICYSAQFVDLCSRTLLSKLKGPKDAATTQLQLELMDARTDIIGLMDITRIWASFHFLPQNLYARKPKRTKRYLNKYRLICGPNGELVKKTVCLAKDKPLQSVGIAMHVLADTWAHSYFAGTPSLVINNTDREFYEVLKTEEGLRERQIKFRHNPSAPDDLQNGLYTNSLYQMIEKNNPSDYLHAFCQMICAMQYLRGEREDFETDRYAFDTIASLKERIMQIIETRQLSASGDWKALGEELSGETVEDFDLEKYQDEYLRASADDKPNTYLGEFFAGAIAHKGMVCDNIFKSGNPLAGFVAVKNGEKI